MRVRKKDVPRKMLKIKEIPEEMIPGGFIRELPKECKVCGEDLEITEALTEVVCRNIDCKEKLYYRMGRMVEKLGCDIGEEEIREFIDKRGIQSPYGLLAYNSSIDGEFVEGYGEEASENITRTINKKRGVLLWEYIELGEIKGLEGNIERVVGGYNNLTEFYKDLEAGGVRFVQSKMVDETEGIYVNAVIVYNALILHKKELETYIRAVVIQKEEESRGVYFAIDPPWMTRLEVIEYIMEETRRKYYIYESKDIRESDYIIMGDTKTVKETSMVQEMSERTTYDIVGVIEDIMRG